MPAPDPESTRQTNPILIVGPGALGLSLAGSLEMTGQHVVLLDHRPERARRLRKISIVTDAASFSCPMHATVDATIAARCKRIIICVKAYATANVAQTMAPFVQPKATILSLQNGLGNRAALQAIPGNPHLRLGIARYGAYRRNDTTVVTTSRRHIQMAGMASDPIVAAWKQCLEAAGFIVEQVPDEAQMIWTKLVINAAINPVTTQYGIRNGELPAHPQAWQHACDLLAESVRIARSIGVPMEHASMQQTLRAVCQQTATNYSSMLMDARAGKPTEIDAINGAIAKIATQQGIPAPLNEKATAAIAQLTSNAAGRPQTTDPCFAQGFLLRYYGERDAGHG